MSIGDNNNGAVAGSFTLSAQMPNGKSLAFSGYVLQGEAEADINQKLDLAARAVERQRLAAEIPELEAKLSQMEDAKRQIGAILEDLGSRAANGDKLSSQEKQTLNTMRVNAKKVEDDIEAGKRAIDKARQLTERQAA